MPAAQRCQHPARTSHPIPAAGREGKASALPHAHPPHKAPRDPRPEALGRSVPARSPALGGAPGGVGADSSQPPPRAPPAAAPPDGRHRPPGPPRSLCAAPCSPRSPPVRLLLGTARLGSAQHARSSGERRPRPRSTRLCPALPRSGPESSGGCGGRGPDGGEGAVLRGRGALLPSRTPGSAVPSGRCPMGARGIAPRLEAARIPGLAAAMATPGTMVSLIPPLPGYQPPVLGRRSGGSPVSHRGGTWAVPARCAPCSRRGKGRRLLLAKYLATFRLMLLNILVTPWQYINS